MIGICYMTLILFTTFVIYILVSLAIERKSKNQSEFIFVITSALDICLRAFICKQPTPGLKSQTFKCIVLIMMTLGFVVLTYYRAQMNAALNVDSNIFPINTWKEVDKSNYKILLQKGTTDEDKFKLASNGSILKKIYDEKIVPIPNHEQVSTIGFNGSIHKIMSGNDYIATGPIEAYQRSAYYPCNITDIKSLQ